MYRVLIIDDDKLARKGIISMVDWASCNMEVVGDVSNGALGLTFLENHAVDLAVVDLSMPVLSGLGFIKESRARYPNLQYVALSFHEEFEYVQSVLRYGAIDYISKLRLEQEDCNQIFMRVSSVLDSLALPSQKNNLTDAEYQTLYRDCNSLTWVYDREEMEKMIDTLHQSGLSSHQLDRLLISVSLAVQQSFQLEIPSITYSDIDEGINSLRSVWEQIITTIYEAQTPSTPAASILLSIRYIRSHLAEPDLKVEEIAEHVNMSRGYFSNLFKKHTNQTVNRFIQKMRIQLAKRLLQHEDLSVIELAERVGYKDEKYFSRLFLEQIGMNCTEFRRQLLTEQQNQRELVDK